MRERKCCTECSRRRRKVKECKPRGPGRKCWTCQKWNRECSFVHDYPPALKGLVFELSREVRDFFPFSCHRFVIVGGERTGAVVHQDPKASGAWNTGLFGGKRWGSVPPSGPLPDLWAPARASGRLS